MITTIQLLFFKNNDRNDDKLQFNYYHSFLKIKKNRHIKWVTSTPCCNFHFIVLALLWSTEHVQNINSERIFIYWTVQNDLSWDLVSQRSNFCCVL